MLCVHDSLHKDKELGGDNYVQDSRRLAELSLGNSVFFAFFSWHTLENGKSRF